MPNIVWSATEKDWLKRNAGSMSDEDLAAELTKMSRRNVTVKSVRHMRTRLGLIKGQGRGHYEISKTT